MNKAPNHHTHFRLFDEKGVQIFSDMAFGCDACLRLAKPQSELVSPDNLSARKRRRGCLVTPHGRVEYCTSDPDLVASTRQFAKALELNSRLLPRLSEITKEVEKRRIADVRRLTHNLTSISAHLLQDLYALFDQDELGKGTKEQKATIKNILLEQPNEAAAMTLRILKHATAMKTDLSVFSKLRGATFQPDFKRHNIHRVIRNAAAVFFQEFFERNVSLTIDPIFQDVLIDYESFSVALFHFFQNAAKYVSHNSDVRIRFSVEEKHIRIVFQMDSLEISTSECERIFGDAERGAAPQKLQIPGDGYGLGVIRDLIRLNRGEFIMRPGMPYGSSLAVGYARNEFEILAPLFPARLKTQAHIGGQTFLAKK